MTTTYKELVVQENLRAPLTLWAILLGRQIHFLGFKGGFKAGLKIMMLIVISRQTLLSRTLFLL